MPSAADRAKAATIGEMATRAQYEVLRAGREKVQQSSPRWRRVTDGSPCGFCAMVASRGPVYHSQESAEGYHARCGCTAEPFDGDPAEWEPSPDEQRFLEAYQESYQTGVKPGDLAARIEEALGSASAPPPLAATTRASLFDAEQLRDALDPTRKRTAAAITKELEATTAGKDLTAAIKQFTETRGGVANLRKNIEATLDGTASPAVRARAEAFLDAMNSYPTEDVPPLFRGFAVKVEENTDAWWDAFEAQFQPGQKFTLNASSFSSSEKKAAEFSRMIGGTKQASKNHTAVRMVLEGDVSALPVEQLSKFKAEKEWITGGEFEVVGYEPATAKNPYYKVIIRQVEKLAKS